MCVSIPTFGELLACVSIVQTRGRSSLAGKLLTLAYSLHPHGAGGDQPPAEGGAHEPTRDEE